MPPRWWSHRGIFPAVWRLPSEPLQDRLSLPFLKRDNVNLLDCLCAFPHAGKWFTAVVKNDWDLKLFTFSKLSLDIPPFSCSSVEVPWSKPQWDCLAFNLAFTFLTEPVTSQHSSPGLQASWSCHWILSDPLTKFSQWIFEQGICPQNKKRISKAHTFPALFLEPGAWTAILCPTCCAPGQQIHTSSSFYTENLKISKYFCDHILKVKGNRIQSCSGHVMNEDNLSHLPLQRIFSFCLDDHEDLSCNFLCCLSSIQQNQAFFISTHMLPSYIL